MKKPYFRYEPDDENPGWYSWEAADPTRFNASMGKLIVRPEGERSARVRMVPQLRHSNLGDGVHGGVLLAFVDLSLFAGAHAAGGIDAGHAVTVDLSAQFVGAAKPELPIDCEVEMVRETGRLVFLRGRVVQFDTTVLSYLGTISKVTRDR